MKKHYQQLDLLKGAAIISVLLLHALPKESLLETYAVFHIWQAVPVFMVVMGITTGLSVSARSKPFKKLYTVVYFKKKATRILYPFLLTFLLALLLGLLWEKVFQRDVLVLNELTFVGLLPVPGDGNYFITLLLQSILLLPLIGYLFQQKPVATSVVLVLLEVLFLYLCARAEFSEKERYLYSAAFPRYFSAVVYGLWLSRLLGELLKPLVFLSIALAAIAGGLFLYYLLYSDLSVGMVRDSWETQQVLTFGYAAFLVYLAFVLFPDITKQPLLTFFSSLGRASYHIFLVQVVYFGLAPEGSGVVQSLLVCLPLGYLFFRLDMQINTMFN